MEKPTFPLPPGKYLVTGDRKVTTVLTIQPKDKDGNQRWELADGATLYDVTHLGCRSARYKPATANNSCSPRTFGPPVSGESRGGHARRERLPQAGLHGSHRRWAARHLLRWPDCFAADDADAIRVSKCKAIAAKCRNSSSTAGASEAITEHKATRYSPLPVAVQIHGIVRYPDIGALIKTGWLMYRNLVEIPARRFSGNA